MAVKEKEFIGYVAEKGGITHRKIQIG